MVGPRVKKKLKTQMVRSTGENLTVTGSLVRLWLALRPGNSESRATSTDFSPPSLPGQGGANEQMSNTDAFLGEFSEVFLISENVYKVTWNTECCDNIFLYSLQQS